MPLAILLSNLFFSYGKNPILKSVHLEIAPGERIGIIGPNGGGKTTLLKILMGFLKPQKGRVSLFGLPPDRMRHKIGYVPQVQDLDRDFPITVSELILLGAPLQSFFYTKAIKKKSEELIEELGLSAYKKEPFSSLSGGLIQKAFLARALLPDPDLLFLDEPLANVDLQSSRMILDQLESLKSKTILMVTHDLKTIVERFSKILCVQTTVSTLLPTQVCEHFALGLYHAPLIDLPANHFMQGLHVSP